MYRDFPGGSDGKVSICNAGEPGSILGSGRSPGEGNGNPLQYSCLENPMDGGAIIHGFAKSRTRLRDFPFTLNVLGFIAIQRNHIVNYCPKVKLTFGMETHV